MRKIIVELLALTLGFTAVSCNNQQGSNPKSRIEEETEDNPLLKELQEIIDKSSGLGLKKGVEFINSKVEEVYKSMNDALARKDLPGFVRAYQEADLFGKQLEGIADCFGGSYHWLDLFIDININYFGSIHTKIMANPQILDDWPAYCGSVNLRARSLAEGLYDFNRNRHLSFGYKVRGKAGNGHDIQHQDETLLIINSRNIHSSAISNGEGRYFLDGTHTEMWFSEQANVMVYNLITNTHSESPLESTAHRECSFIDLGMDGIDACDARLNGVKESDIPIANERAVGCMAKTTEVLKRRYAGTGFIR